MHVQSFVLLIKPIVFFLTVSLPLLSWHLKVPIVVIFVNVFIVIILIIISLSTPLARLRKQPSLFAPLFQRRFPRDLRNVSGGEERRLFSQAT